MTNCEAKYGDRKCEKEATKTVISQGQMFSLCKSCAVGNKTESTK